MPPTIDTNGAAVGCEDVCRWCEEVSGVRRGWLIRILAHLLLICTRSAFLEWLGEVFSEVAPNNRYTWRWTSGIQLIKRPGARRIPFFSGCRPTYATYFPLSFPWENPSGIFPRNSFFLVYLRSRIHKARFSRIICLISNFDNFSECGVVRICSDADGDGQSEVYLIKG